MYSETNDIEHQQIIEEYFWDTPSYYCTFCNLLTRGKLPIVFDLDTCVGFYDNFPVTEGHLLIIPKIHKENFDELTPQEYFDTRQIIKEYRKYAKLKDSSITGWNIGWNDGEDAGQTIFHVHCHLIPRRNGDIDNPIGGIRGCIPEKRIYK